MDNRNANALQNLENRFYDIFSEFMQQPNPDYRPRFRSSDSDYDIISMLLQQYTGTMRDYNANIRQIIRLISTHQASRSTNIPSSRNHFRNESANPFRYYYTTQWATNLQRPEESNAILTREEISRKTITYGFTEDMIIRDENGENTNACPISLEPFHVGDVVCEIRGCRHKFKRPNLMTWFRRNSNCPVCRFNLSQTVEESDSDDSAPNDGSGNDAPISGNESRPVSENIQNLQSTITEILQGFLNGNSNSNLDISGNRLLYEFEIPMNALFNRGPNSNEFTPPDVPDVD